jgi:phage terminase small subunit
MSRAKPLKLLTGHFTKAEKAARKEAEIWFGDKTLTIPGFVRRDPAARAKWYELKKLYADVRVDFVTSGDIGHIARYCKLYAEYLRLVKHRESINKIEPLSSVEEAVVKEDIEDRLGARRAAKMWQKIEYIMSVDGLIDIDSAINKKAVLLTAMEDRLLLNPLAKIRAIPRQKKESERDPLEKEGFGNI